MQHTSFYHVTEPDFDAIDQYGTTSRAKLMAFLADEGTADMRVFENGTDITASIAMEMLRGLAWDEDPSEFVEAFTSGNHNGPAYRERNGVRYQSEQERV